MSFLGLLDRTFSVQRRSAALYSGVTLTSALTGLITPAQPYGVELQASGGTVAGIITVYGTSGGAPASQALFFPSAGGRSTTRTFDANTAITVGVVGWTGAWVLTGYAVNLDGSRVSSLATAHASVPGRINRAKGQWPLPRDGSQQRERAKLFAAPVSGWTPEEGDVLTDLGTGARWRTVNVPAFDDFATLHHYEVNIERDER